MVKLDLEINEIIGLAELGKIDEKKLKKFLKVATKEELEDYLVETAMGNQEQDISDDDVPEPPEEDQDL